jgi:WD40 repeat protein
MQTSALTRYLPFSTSSLTKPAALSSVEPTTGKSYSQPTFALLTYLNSVIKVWDRETLTLQASLHGHFDYITDIDVSKCNRFIASAGKDAQTIIWEMKTGKIVKKLNQHTQLINRIQFITPKIKKQ